ncbi:MAG: hypothetical protein LBR85_09200 [Oscillospiraceae bacterium]|jgi:hypothetical protein|nr:hypothetical protein [Oscillospiraceae bacterium]
MDPRKVNVLIAAITNQLYSALSKDDFLCLGIFLNELGKSMLSTNGMRELGERMDARNGENP